MILVLNFWKEPFFFDKILRHPTSIQLQEFWVELILQWTKNHWMVQIAFESGGRSHSVTLAKHLTKWWVVLLQGELRLRSTWAWLVFFSQSGSSRWSSWAEARAICQAELMAFPNLLWDTISESSTITSSSLLLVFCNLNCWLCTHTFSPLY